MARREGAGATAAVSAMSTGDLTANEVEVRSLASTREFDQCVALQVAVWGSGDGDVIPRRVFVVASHIGGQVFGAFTGDELAGFAMALPGVRDGEAYLHSHMLAVLPQFRDARLGRRLKLAQRADALARGYRAMEWTFDPLEIKNAYVNLRRLGATCARYEPDFYGPSSSPLQGGLPTDRLCARWELGSERVRRVLEGLAGAELPVERVHVPAAIPKWKASEATRDRARGAQAEIRMRLERGFRQGLRATDYAVDAEGNGEYLLTP